MEVEGEQLVVVVVVEVLVEVEVEHLVVAGPQA